MSLSFKIRDFNPTKLSNHNQTEHEDHKLLCNIGNQTLWLGNCNVS